MWQQVSLSLALDYFRSHSSNPDTRLIRWTQFTIISFLLFLNLSSASIQSYLQVNLEQMLGADVVIGLHQPMTSSQRLFLANRADKTSLTILKDITLTNASNWQSAQLKMVDENYPIEGYLQLSEADIGQQVGVAKGPDVGDVWVDARLFRELGLSIGQILQVAGQRLTLSNIIHHEPDRLLEGHSVAMRVMVNQGSFPEAYFRQSEMRFNYLLSASEHTSKALSQWARQHLTGAQVMGKYSGHPLATFWSRVQNFLGLASVLLFILGAIAIDLSARRQVVHEMHFSSICQSMGLTRGQSCFISIVNWGLNFLSALIPAILCAYVAQYMLVKQLQSYFPGVISSWSIDTLIMSVLALTMTFLVFHFSTLIQLAGVNISQLLKSQRPAHLRLIRLLWILVSMSIIVSLYSDNVLLTFMILGGMLFTVLLLAFITWLVLTLGESIARRFSGLLPFSFFMMRHRLLSKTVQILGVGLCLMLLLFSTTLVKDLNSTIGNYKLEQDGNLIITKADASHVTNIQAWAEQNSSQIKQLKAYLPSHLLAINNQELNELSLEASDSQQALNNELRLHTTNTLPANNLITSGQFWDQQSESSDIISVEDDVLNDLGLELGDNLTFSLGSQQRTFRIVASHKYKAGHGSITFWFMAPEKLASELAVSTKYMGSMALPQQAWAQLHQLWDDNAGLMLQSVKEYSQNLGQSLRLLSQALITFAVLTIVLAVLVILTAARNFEADDRLKNSLLLSCGHKKSSCITLTIYEWLITGGIAGIGAISGTLLIAHLLYESQFSMAYQPDWLWLTLCLVVSMGLMCVVGIFACQNTLKASIRELAT